MGGGGGGVVFPAGFGGGGGGVFVPAGFGGGGGAFPVGLGGAGGGVFVPAGFAGAGGAVFAPPAAGLGALLAYGLAPYFFAYGAGFFASFAPSLAAGAGFLASFGALLASFFPSAGLAPYAGLAPPAAPGAPGAPPGAPGGACYLDFFCCFPGFITVVSGRIYVTTPAAMVFPPYLKANLDPFVIVNGKCSFPLMDKLSPGLPIFTF